MATSGNSTLTVTRNDIIRQAALEVSAIGGVQTMGAQMVSDFAFKLNAIIKEWQGKGMHVWTVTEATLFPVSGQTKYQAGNSSSDHITETWYATTLSADEAAGETTLSLTSTSNIGASDNIGITLDDGSIQWTTVSSKTSTTATVAAALTGAASSGNKVFNYTSRIARPVHVVNARRHDISSGRETPIELVARQEYRDLPIKTETGAINQVFYDRQRDAGYFYLWSVPSPIDTLVSFTWHRPFEVFSTSSNNPDFPEEWSNCLIWNLAKDMMGRYPVAPQRRAIIEDRARETLSDMQGFGREDENIYFQPAIGRR